MATQLEVVNGALVLIGEGLLSSMSDAREPARLASSIWTRQCESCLKQWSWNFAIRTVRLDADAGLTPSFGFAYAFELPTDWLRTVVVSTDEYCQTPHRTYREEGGLLISDVDPLYLRYVSKDVSWGMNLADWPVDFALYVEAHMAASLAQRIRESKADDMRKLAEQRKRKALSVDALGQPPDPKPPGRFMSARMRGAAYRSRIWRV